MLTADGVAVSVVPVPTWTVTGITLSGAGAFTRCTLPVVVPTGRLPQLATVVNVSPTPAILVVPPDVGVTESHEGTAFGSRAVVFTVNGVPPGAAETTLTICED